MVTGAAQLEVVAGKATGMSILVEDELLIGRQAEGAGRLAEDDEISRAHARVTVDRGGFCAIEDLGSTNGTFVNGLRIGPPTALGPGDTVELGGTTLVVRSLPSSEPPTATAPADTSPRAVPTMTAAPTGSPVLSLQLDVDFAAGTAQLHFQDAPEPQRFVLDQGTWRAESVRSTEKGGPR